MPFKLGTFQTLVEICGCMRHSKNARLQGGGLRTSIVGASGKCKLFTLLSCLLYPVLRQLVRREVHVATSFAAPRGGCFQCPNWCRVCARSVSQVGVVLFLAMCCVPCSEKNDLLESNTSIQERNSKPLFVQSSCAFASCRSDASVILEASKRTATVRAVGQADVGEVGRVGFAVTAVNMKACCTRFPAR